MQAAAGLEYPSIFKAVMYRTSIITLVFLLILYPCLGYSKEYDLPGKARFGFSGSYKNLLAASETQLFQENYWSDLNRLRLDFDLDFAEHFHIKTILDNEILLGSLLEKRGFMQIKTDDSDTFFDLDHTVIDNNDLFWRQSLYRLYLTFSTRQSTLIIGRQRIGWGTGRIWNPTDLFNPISPLKLERGEKTGVDAINFEYFFGSLSSFNIVYAHREDREDSSLGIKAGINLRGYDLSAMLGEFREDKVVGFDFAGNIGDAGFRGEATYTDKKSGEEFVRFVLSWDYSFPNTLYLLFEYLYNGGNLGNLVGTKNMSPSSSPQIFSGEIVTRNRNFIASDIGYEITPLFGVSLLSIYDVDGKSFFLGPTLTYNILSNLDWTAGMQVFSGDVLSEFGNLPDTYYTSWEWFF